MKENIPISQEEMDQLNDLKTRIQKNIFELGELYLEKMELDVLYKNLSDKEKNLRNNVDEFKRKEIELMDVIFQKYGEGSLNIATGTFIPN